MKPSSRIGSSPWSISASSRSRAVAASAANTASVSSKIPRSAVWARNSVTCPAVSTVGGGTATCSLATDPASSRRSWPTVSTRAATAASSALRPSRHTSARSQLDRSDGLSLATSTVAASRCTSLKNFPCRPGAAARNTTAVAAAGSPASASTASRAAASSPSASWTTTTRPPPNSEAVASPIANPSGSPPPRTSSAAVPGPSRSLATATASATARSANSSSSPRTSVTGTDPGRAAMPACYPAPTSPGPTHGPHPQRSGPPAPGLRPRHSSSGAGPLVVGRDQAPGGGLAPCLDHELAELGRVDGRQLDADPAVAADVGRDPEGPRGGGDQGGLLLLGRLDGGLPPVIGHGGEHLVPDPEGRVTPGLPLLRLRQ